MGVVIPEGYAQLAYKIALTGKPAPFVVTMGVNPSDIMSPNAVAFAGYQAATALGSVFGTATPGQWCNQYTFVSCTATLMTDTGPITAEHLEPIAGSVTSEVTPPNCAILMRKVTSQGGRQGRGRSYWPNAWIAENGIDARGVIQSVSVGVLNGFFNTLLQELEDALIPAVLLHSSPSLAPSLITDVFCESLTATQRRRLRR